MHKRAHKCEHLRTYKGTYIYVSSLQLNVRECTTNAVISSYTYVALCSYINAMLQIHTQGFLIHAIHVNVRCHITFDTHCVNTPTKFPIHKIYWCQLVPCQRVLHIQKRHAHGLFLSTTAPHRDNDRWEGTQPVVGPQR